MSEVIDLTGPPSPAFGPPELVNLTGPSSPSRFGPPELVDLTGPTPEADRTPAQPFSLRNAGNVQPVDTPVAFARILADDDSLPSLPANLDMDMLEEEQPKKKPRCEAYPNRIWQAVGEEKYN